MRLTSIFFLFVAPFFGCSPPKPPLTIHEYLAIDEDTTAQRAATWVGIPFKDLRNYHGEPTRIVPHPNGGQLVVYTTTPGNTLRPRLGGASTMNTHASGSCEVQWFITPEGAVLEGYVNGQEAACTLRVMKHPQGYVPEGAIAARITALRGKPIETVRVRVEGSPKSDRYGNSPGFVETFATEECNTFLWIDGKGLFVGASFRGPSCEAAARHLGQ